LSRPIVERRMPWARGRFWRPGEPVTVTENGVSVTYLLRGVTRDWDPDSAYATVLLEPVRSVAADADDIGSAAG
jgi:hypothetical protein